MYKRQVLELPEDLKKELDTLGLHIVYGMEWLQKNGYSQKKNQELVRRNPFLPYALILSGQEMEKLAKSGRNICTSFPVPIVEREKIEEIQEKYTDKLVHFPGISFYIPVSYTHLVFFRLISIFKFVLHTMEKELFDISTLL